MPIINGVKMACASCIRGHRSTTCQHLDRPMLEVRKKGRPLTQCDHCRDLRKVRQVHVRCMCKPDESEAPKRVNKGKEKAAPTEQENSNCDCDNTGVCNCAVPRTAVSKTGRRFSSKSKTGELVTPVTIQPHTSPSRTPDGCSSSDDSSLTSGSSHCATVVGQTPSSSVPLPSPLQIAPPVDVLNSTIRPSTSHFDPLVDTAQHKEGASFSPSFQLRMQAKSQRYAPYPQSLPNAPISYALSGPSPFVEEPSYDSSNLSNSTSIPEDATTAQMWTQFLRDELPSSISIADQTPSSHLPPSSQPQLKCSCGPTCVCGSCATQPSPPENPTPSNTSITSDSQPSPFCLSSTSPSPASSLPTEVDCFDCSVLMAALDLDDDEISSTITTFSGLDKSQLQVIQREAHTFLATYSPSNPSTFSLTKEQLFQYANFLTATVDRPAGVGFGLGLGSTTLDTTTTTSPPPPPISLASTPFTNIPLTVAALTNTEPPPSKIVGTGPGSTLTSAAVTLTENTRIGGSTTAMVGERTVSKCSCGPGCTCAICSGNTSGLLDLSGDRCHKCSTCEECVNFNQTLSELSQCLGAPPC
ncbi:hypothetical protein FRC14_007600 [Serendipita sp. 396]|nr:hypothetical protein FRC14_007600 [Serendipita sp. 396]